MKRVSVYDKHKKVIFYTVYEVGKNGTIVYTGEGDIVVSVLKNEKWEKLSKMIDNFRQKYPCNVYPMPNGVLIVSVSNDISLRAIRRILYY